MVILHLHFPGGMFDRMLALEETSQVTEIIMIHPLGTLSVYDN